VHRSLEGCEVDLDVCGILNGAILDVEVDVDDDHIGKRVSRFAGRRAKVRALVYGLAEKRRQLLVGRMERRLALVDLANLPVARRCGEINADDVVQRPSGLVGNACNGRGDS
jgi:hypothetical protein